MAVELYFEGSPPERIWLPAKHPPATDDLLRAYAKRPVLLENEATAILQGLIPPAVGSEDEGLEYSNHHAGVVRRFCYDARHEVVAIPCTPMELVEWADRLRVALPGAFVSAVRDASAATAAASQQRGFASKPNKAPKSDAGKQLNAVWQKAAEDYAADFYLKRGRYPSKAMVARGLVADLAPATKARIERMTRNTWNPDGRANPKKR